MSISTVKENTYKEHYEKEKEMKLSNLCTERHRMHDVMGRKEYR